MGIVESRQWPSDAAGGAGSIQGCQLQSVRVRVAKLHADQTVGSSVMNARVVAESGGFPAVEVLAHAPPQCTVRSE